MFKKNIILFVSIVFLSHELLAQGFFGNIANVVSNLLENQRQASSNQGGGTQQPQQYQTQRQYQPQYQDQYQTQPQYQAQYQPQPQYQSQQFGVSPGSAAFGFPAPIATPIPSPIPSANPTAPTPISAPVNTIPVQTTIPVAPAPIATTSITPANFDVTYDPQKKEFSAPSVHVKQYEKGVVSIPGGFPVYYDPQNKDFTSDKTNILPYEIIKTSTPATPVVTPTPTVTPPPPPVVVTPAPVVTPPSPPVTPPTPAVITPPSPIVIPVASSAEAKIYNPLDETIADFTDSKDIFDKNLLPQTGPGTAGVLKPISKIPALGQMLCERCMRGQFANSPEASDECIRQCVVIYRGLFNPEPGKNDQSFPDTPDSLNLENAYQKEHSQALNRGSDDRFGNNIANQENRSSQQNGGQGGQRGRSSVENLNPYTAVDEAPLPRRLPSAAARKRPGAASGAR